MPEAEENRSRAERDISTPVGRRGLPQNASKNQLLERRVYGAETNAGNQQAAERGHRQARSEAGNVGTSQRMEAHQSDHSREG